MVSSTDFANAIESYQRRCVVKVWTALTTLSSYLLWKSMSHKISTMLMRPLYSTNHYKSMLNCEQGTLKRYPVTMVMMSYGESSWFSPTACEEVHVSKLHQSKDHMSILLCTNMNGSEKRNPVLTGKAAHPTALKKHGVTFKDLGIEYFWSQEGWMTGPVFNLWLTDCNNNLIKQNHCVLLLIYNAPGHITGEYSNIRIQFYHPILQWSYSP